ncbi:MAG TPA: MFS transporter, partial [Cytophagales bacterium]|nr:MFS transporter [Cytophagales bacterium]
ESLDKAHRRNFEWKNTNPFAAFKNLNKFRVVLGLIIGEFLVFLSAKAVETNWNFYTIYKFGWDDHIVGYSLAFVGVAIALVQGLLIRVLIPKIGEINAVYLGMVFEITGLILFGLATEGWMMFVFLIPYALGGIGGAALQGIISNQVPNDQQGELQGTINGLNSITYIIGPLLMNQLFYYFTSKHAPFIFPGAPFMMGSILAAAGLIICFITLRRSQLKTN